MIVTNCLSNITVPFSGWVMVLPIYSGLQIFRFSSPGEESCTFKQKWAVFLLVCTSPFLPGYLFEIVLVPFTFNGSNPSPFCKAHEQRTFFFFLSGWAWFHTEKIRFVLAFPWTLLVTEFAKAIFLYHHTSHPCLSKKNVCCSKWHSPFPITQ